MIVMYDSMVRRTAENVSDWVREFLTQCGDENVPCIILANKQDLDGAKVVSVENVKRLCTEFSNIVAYFEISVKTRENMQGIVPLLLKTVLLDPSRRGTIYLPGRQEWFHKLHKA